MIGEGNIGLIRAAEQFQPRYGTRFSTYASYWIKQSIRQAVCNSTSLIRLPTLHTSWPYLGSGERPSMLWDAMSSPAAPSFDEVARVSGLSDMQKVLLSKAQHARQLKLESTVAGETGRWSAVESLDPSGTPGGTIESLEDRLLLRSRMEFLDGRERIILSLRFGLDNGEPMTLKEIGTKLGVTREWVRRIELNAICKLRGENRSKLRDSSRGSSPPGSKPTGGISSAQKLPSPSNYRAKKKTPG